MARTRSRRRRAARGKKSTTTPSGVPLAAAEEMTRVAAPRSGATASALGHLTAAEIATVAAASATANFEAVFAKRNVLTRLKTDELRNLVQMAEATRAHCGGVVCG